MAYGRLSMCRALVVFSVFFLGAVSFADDQNGLANSAGNSTTLTQAQSREEIRYLLDLERDVRTVDEAMRLKTQGLRYVRSLDDFDYLCTLMAPNPSDAYRRAVSTFIATSMGQFVYSYRDLPAVAALEEKTVIVGEAMAVKSAGLRVVENIYDFNSLIPFSVPNPSETYRQEVSAFVGQNIRVGLDAYTPIDLIIQAETYTKFVSDAMAVKNAGLVAVHTQRDLRELATFSVANPSETYRRAVNDFVVQHLGDYPY